MSFKLVGISSFSEFTTWASALWISYNNPPTPWFHCILPIASTVSAAIDDIRDRFYEDSREDPTFHYFIVIDISTLESKVVGGGSWSIYLEDPFAKEQKSGGRGVYWFPEGSDFKKFTEILLGKRIGINLQRARRPHAGELDM